MLQRGTTLENFTILEVLGQGGMGTVYLAWDSHLERQVALKILHPFLANDLQVRERFYVEAAALAQLKHPGIMELHAIIEAQGQSILVLEYIEGDRLDSVLDRTGPLSWTIAVPLFLKLLESIEHAHAHGILHRDLKTSNILVTPQGTPKLLDFGIARITARQGLTKTGILMGTPQYIAPELIEGHAADERTDLYALGIILFELLTGQLPFQGATDFAVLRHHLETPVPSVTQYCPAVPDWLDGILSQALSKSPTRRFQTIAEFRTALTTGLKLKPVFNPRETPAFIPVCLNPTRVLSRHNPAAGQRVRRQKQALAAILCGVSLVGGFVGMQTKSSSDLVTVASSIQPRETTLQPSFDPPPVPTSQVPEDIQPASSTGCQIDTPGPLPEQPSSLIPSPEEVDRIVQPIARKPKKLVKLPPPPVEESSDLPYTRVIPRRHSGKEPGTEPGSSRSSTRDDASEMKKKNSKLMNGMKALGKPFKKIGGWVKG